MIEMPPLELTQDPRTSSDPRKKNFWQNAFPHTVDYRATVYIKPLIEHSNFMYYSMSTWAENIIKALELKFEEEKEHSSSPKQSPALQPLREWLEKLSQHQPLEIKDPEKLSCVKMQETYSKLKKFHDNLRARVSDVPKYDDIKPLKLSGHHLGMYQGYLIQHVNGCKEFLEKIINIMEGCAHLELLGSRTPFTYKMYSTVRILNSTQHNRLESTQEPPRSRTRAARP